MPLMEQAFLVFSMGFDADVLVACFPVNRAFRLLRFDEGGVLMGTI